MNRKINTALEAIQANIEACKKGKKKTKKMMDDIHAEMSEEKVTKNIGNVLSMIDKGDEAPSVSQSLLRKMQGMGLILYIGNGQGFVLTDDGRDALTVYQAKVTKGRSKRNAAARARNAALADLGMGRVRTVY